MVPGNIVRDPKEERFLNMKKALALAGLGSLAVAGAASASFSGAVIESLGELTPGVTTYRVYVDYSNPADKLLAISGNAAVSALSFTADSPLVNASLFAGLAQEDFYQPFPISQNWDSYVIIGSTATHNTQMSPGFLGGNGVTSVIQGSSFSQANNGGYFDSNPGTPEQGGHILIAQFSLATGSNFTYCGTADSSQGGQLNNDAFCVTTVPAPGALALLGLAGLASRRRRA